jgi:hypothetical protein
MREFRTCYRKVLLLVAAVSMVAALALKADVPKGWLLAGSKPGDFDAGVDGGQAFEGHGSAYLKSRSTASDGFGTMMQSISAEKYKGNRIRLSGVVKSERVMSWAGLWLRVDRGTESLGFDNMQKRPIKGTTEWQRYEVVLDVPRDATGISFGILLNGAGEVWLSGTKLEVVGAEVPVTNLLEKHLPEQPVNLEFNEEASPK